MAIAFDQNLGSMHNNSSVSTFALTTTASAASASLIVVCVSWYNSTARTLTMSGGGLTWTTAKAVKATGNDTGPQLAIAWAQAPSGLASGTTLTATLSAGSLGGNSIGAMSFTGVATSTPVDVTASSTSSVDATWSGGSLATTNPNDVIVGYGAGDTGASAASASPNTAAGYTEVHDINDTTAGQDFESVYQIVSATSTYTAGGTFTPAPSPAGNGVCGVSVAFKDAASGVPTAIPPLAPQFIYLRKNT